MGVTLEAVHQEAKAAHEAAIEARDQARLVNGRVRSLELWQARLEGARTFGVGLWQMGATIAALVASGAALYMALTDA